MKKEDAEQAVTAIALIAESIARKRISMFVENVEGTEYHTRNQKEAEALLLEILTR